jgi:hypothetical protein
MGTGAGSPPDRDRSVAIVGELHTWTDGVEFTAAEFFDLLKGYGCRGTAKPPQLRGFLELRGWDSNPQPFD